MKHLYVPQTHAVLLVWMEVRFLNFVNTRGEGGGGYLILLYYWEYICGLCAPVEFTTDLHCHALLADREGAIK